MVVYASIPSAPGPTGTPLQRDGAMQRAIIHINVAHFAVAVERLSEPGLFDRPVVVASPGSARALVYDMSAEAYEAGVRKRMALERARRLCRDARLAPPRPHRYRRAMAELFKLARPLSPLIEAEEDTGHLFLDLSGTGRLWGPPQDAAERLRRQARQKLGLEPIWSLAANKLVAKAASRVVKPWGECVVPAGGEEDFLRPLPLGLLPGLEGPDLAALRQFNLTRVEQALAWRSEQLAVVFGRRAIEVHGLLRGRDSSPVLDAEARPPAVATEHEFAEDTNQESEVARALFALVEEAGRRLRAQSRAARRVGLAVVYSDGARVVRQRSHPQGTANDFLLFDLARAALALAWTRRVRLRHLRLVCDRLVFPPAQLELSLTADPEAAERGRRERLMAALDQIRGRHGRQAIRLGRLLEGQESAGALMTSPF